MLFFKLYTLAFAASFGNELRDYVFVASAWKPTRGSGRQQKRLAPALGNRSSAAQGIPDALLFPEPLPTVPEG